MDRAETFLSLIVPVFNEESRLTASLPSVVSFLQDHFKQWEIIFSDDGSTDSTVALIQSIRQKNPLIALTASPVNRGKGAAVRRGFESASGNLLLFSDADFSAPIEESLKLIAALESGYDVAIGSRGLDESDIQVRQSWPRETMGKTFNLLLRTLLPIPYHDTQCGFKMFRRAALDALLPRLKVDGFAFDVEMLVVAQQRGLQVAEVPVVWRDVRESKVHPIRSSLHMLKDVFAIRYRLAMNLYA